MEFLSKNEGETDRIAQDFVNNLAPKTGGATIVGLYGDLGTGKTTFMKYLAQAFGLKEAIQSPTFVIMKKYHLTSLASRVDPLHNVEREDTPVPGEVAFDSLIHIDAYRIEDPQEMLVLGWEEMVKDPKNLICIEWPERLSKILPQHIIIRFEHTGGSAKAGGPERSEGSNENERKISINF